MSRLIDADNLVALVNDATILGEGFKQAFIAIVNGEPTAHPEITHCKDCKHYNAGFECLIEGYGIERDKNWYCGDAERREDDE